MPKYEINLWKEIELVSKEVTYFENDADCHSYVNKKYHVPESWTQNVIKNGKLRWRPNRGIRVTWGKLPEYNYKPKKILTDDDRALQTKLDKSITLESIKEFEEDQYKELMEKGGLKSKSNVHSFIHQLHKRGWIKFNNGRNRSISIV